MDIKEIYNLRRKKLKVAVDECKSAAEFARANNMEATYLRQLLSGHRVIGEKAARQIEQSSGRPTGWLDSESDLHAEILNHVSNMDESELLRVQAFILGLRSAK